MNKDNSSATAATAAAVSAVPKVSDEERWAAVSVPKQLTETMADPDVARGKWNAIYAACGVSSEGERDGVFGAVMHYFVKNGSSPEGRYAHVVNMPNGRKLPAGVVTKITGKLEGEIRQFLRADLKKTYTCVKHLKSLKEDEYLLAEAERWGIAGGRTWLLADFLNRCPYFVGDEDRVYEDVRAKKIAAAGERRRGAVVTPSTPAAATHVKAGEIRPAERDAGGVNPFSAY